MFENGSYLRRRKRFKLLKDAHIKSDEDEDKSITIKKPITKTSFLIDNLLANDTSTNTSSTTSSSSSCEINNNTLHQLQYTTDFQLLRKLTLFNDINGHKSLSQQFYW